MTLHITTTDLRGQDFLTLADLSPGQLRCLLDRASQLKALQANGQPHPLLAGLSLAMLFEKASLRTRTTFMVGMSQLGGFAVDLMNEHTQIGVRESIPDIARNLERWVDALMARVYAHRTLEELAAWTDIPVINGLSDLTHPCQALADVLTMREHLGDLAGRRLAYVGDGFNVCNSLLFAGALAGMNVRVAAPEGYEPDEDILERAQEIADDAGGGIEIGNHPQAAVSKAEVVYTDAWVSMGLEHEAEQRREIFASFRVDDRMMALADPDAIFMHCLPAHRGEEVTDAVLDGPQSVVFDQAENRLHTQKALLVAIMRGDAAFDELGA
ncbi:MAG: ornithine carbamoyltransferase [Chloroflexota bacterium]|nr:ornithine carbamoyltransferase [Chloroflexota bacterium]